MWYLISGGENYNISKWITHRPSNVEFTNVNSTFRETIPLNNTEDDFTILTQFPYASDNQLHVGTNWGISAAVYNGMTATEKLYYRNQANFRSMRPLYDLSVDTYNNYDTNEGRLTSTFCFRFTANDTISIVDENVNQINITIATADIYSWDYEISGANIYVYSIGYLTGNFKLRYTMSCGAEIKINNISSGIASMPALVVDSFSALTTIS